MGGDSPPAFQSLVPFLDATITSESDIPTLSSVIHGWESVPSDALRVDRISGGITNRIYKLSHTLDASPIAVLVRIFGSHDVFSDAQRRDETAIFEQLGRCGVAPPLLAVFHNGRVEHYLRTRPIELHEMVAPVVLSGVAKAMAKLHTFQPGPSPSLSRQPGVWLALDNWVAEVARMRERNGAFDGLGVDVDKCVTAMQKLRSSLEGSGEPSPVVFCHNDLLCGNILLSSDDGTSLSLVDFEYSSFNYRGFDIGNFFCEAMGGTQDGYVDASLYPSEEARRSFCRVYLNEALGCEAEDEAVLSLVDEAERYGLLTHLYWGFWALVQSASSPIDFPYLLFAEQRFTCFFKKYSSFSS